jgi:apolipoprotein N-acyltransferase
VWTAALWVADEALRGRFPFGGFPWARLGFSQTSGPLTSLAAFGGVPLVSFAVALIGALLAAALLAGRRGRPGRRMAVLGVLVTAVVPAVGALAWLSLPGASLTAGGPSRTVAIIQGNVPRLGLEFNAQRRAVLDNHVEATLRLADQVRAGRAAAPDLVIWPENSSDIDPYGNGDAATAIHSAATAIGAPVLVGAVVDGPGGQHVSNTAIVWDPVTGPGATYVKRHPVPFAEYVPARSFFRMFTDKVDLVRKDFVAGTRPGALDIGGTRIGDVICFEVVDDAIVADTVDRGARMLVVQTNNATFGHTDESAQQLAMSRLRAVEYGRTVVVAATSGISAVVAPDGTVVRRSSLFIPATYDLAIAQRAGTTVAARLGAAPEGLLSAVGAGALLVVLGAGFRARQRGRA